MKRAKVGVIGCGPRAQSSTVRNILDIEAYELTACLLLAGIKSCATQVRAWGRGTAEHHCDPMRSPAVGRGPDACR